MLFGAIGDIHGDFASVRRIMNRHAEVPFWISVGDLADDHGRYEEVPAPLHWIKGNNENFDVIASGDLPASLRFLENGQATEIDVPLRQGDGATSPEPELGERRQGLRIAGLGGTFAPTWYQTPAADLPHPVKGSEKATALADKRRHFVNEEVVRCQALTEIDIFMSHEAARPYRVRGGKGPDAGKTPISEVLASMQPRLHLFGHHHEFSEQVRHNVKSIGLDLVSRSYLLIESASLKYEQVTT